MKRPGSKCSRGTTREVEVMEYVDWLWYSLVQSGRSDVVAEAKSNLQVMQTTDYGMLIIASWPLDMPAIQQAQLFDSIV
jgi:hypothetical protein